MGNTKWIALALAVAVAPANAQPSESVAAAEQLFEEGRALIAKGDLAAACPRFEASYKLDPALGTLLNMAMCYEQLGQLASAWGRYREVVAIAMRAGDAARIKIAKERADALESRLPRLAIGGPGAATPGVVVTRDDVPVDPAVLGAGIYVDPGEHVVHASAPGRRPATVRITIALGETKTVAIPALEVEPDRPVVAPVTTIRIEEDTLDPGRTRRITGLVVGGVGVAAVATGLGFGLAARSQWDSAFDSGQCDRATRACSPEGQEATSSARRHALVSNVVTGAGAAMVAVGAVLYFTAPGKRDVAVAPVAGGGATISVGGAW